MNTLAAILGVLLAVVGSTFAWFLRRQRADVAFRQDVERTAATTEAASAATATVIHDDAVKSISKEAAAAGGESFDAWLTSREAKKKVP